MCIWAHRRIYPPATSYNCGCRRGFNGFTSTKTTPPRMRTAPAAARRDKPDLILLDIDKIFNEEEMSAMKSVAD